MAHINIIIATTSQNKGLLNITFQSAFFFLAGLVLTGAVSVANVELSSLSSLIFVFSSALIAGLSKRQFYFFAYLIKFTYLPAELVGVELRDYSPYFMLKYHYFSI